MYDYIDEMSNQKIDIESILLQENNYINSNNYNEEMTEEIILREDNYFDP